MSAPKTNLENQNRRHSPVLLVIGAVTLFAVLLILYWMFETAERADPAVQGAGDSAPTTNIAPEVIVAPPAANPDADQSPIAPEPTPQTEGEAPAGTPPAAADPAPDATTPEPAPAD